MNIILLSGGSGKRLWPLSNDIRSKQFIKIFKKKDGGYESMVQRVYRQIKSVDKDANVTIATSKSQVSSIHNQLGDDVSISLEPCRRDTFPAIALASAYLVDVLKINLSESVVVCPVDPYVDDSYFEKLKDISDEAKKGKANLVLMGIEPTYPSEKYGYIIPSDKSEISPVKEFKEKPTAVVAEEYIRQGALWNGGVFAYKLSYMMAKAHELIDFADYNDLFNKYDTLTKISFDYAVVEHEKSIEVVKYSGEWKDIGTWNTLTESMSETIVGKGILDDKSTGVNIINEMDVPVLAMGLHDVVISASLEGILVSDKNESSYIKSYVDKFERQIMYAEKSWGNFKVIDVENRSLTIKVTLTPGHSMNYHSHNNRDEAWVVISGKGKAVVDGREQDVKAGDVITMSCGHKHTVTADTELKLIEIQLGDDISVSDKQKFTATDLEYDRWLNNVTDQDVLQELKSLSPSEVEDSFYKNLAFGTGGLRGVIGAGTNRMNVYTVAKATQGLANYLKKQNVEPSVVIGYDSRIKSDLFAKTAASVFVANGVTVNLWPTLNPVPTVSFATRYLHASAGVMITASHNPSKYNGYKVYGEDGCQITTDAASEILAEIDKLDIFSDVKREEFDESKITYIDDSVLSAFIEEVKKQSVLFGDEINKNVAIVYSPLNGTGLKPVTRVLKESGFSNITVVKEQKFPDGNFLTCPYPNPEIKEAMSLGMEYAEKYNADLLLATDPDCDRVGIAVREKGGMKLLTGNEVGMLLLDYICSQRIKHNKMPKNPVMVKTIVSIDMAERIAKHYGVRTIDVLTGFKFIGEQIGLLEKECEADRFIFGFEESYGYLSGSYVRDKDGVDGAFLICEMFAYYKTRGIGLSEKLDELYHEYGYCLNTLHSYQFEGSVGFSLMQSIMQKFRGDLREFGGKKVVKLLDYSQGLDGLPKSDVLKFLLEDNCSIVVRPSGTEPKLKLYVSVSAENKEVAQLIEAEITKSAETYMNATRQCPLAYSR